MDIFMANGESNISNEHKKCAVLIIAYSNTPSISELASFEQCVKILGNHPLILVCPHSLDVTKYLEVSQRYAKQLQLAPFHDAYFTSVKSYNRLMLSIEFYEAFVEHKYILLYQLDAWVFKDELEYWCNKQYDYIGAPWFEGHDTATEKSPLLPVAGNGGFSLRKVQSILKLLSQRISYEHTKISANHEQETPTKAYKKMTVMSFFMKTHANEDTLFVEYGPKLDSNFMVASPQESIAFSFEVNAPVLYKMNNNTLPFGCHAFEKYDWDFWKDKIALPKG